MAATKAPRTVLRYSLAEAAKALSLGYTHFRQLVMAGKFTAVRDNPAHPKARIYVPADEVEAMAVGGLDGLQAFRERKGRK